MVCLRSRVPDAFCSWIDFCCSSKSPAESFYNVSHSFWFSMTVRQCRPPHVKRLCRFFWTFLEMLRFFFCFRDDCRFPCFVWSAVGGFIGVFQNFTDLFFLRAKVSLVFHPHLPSYRGPGVDMMKRWLGCTYRSLCQKKLLVEGVTPPVSL